jgi:hypothetical protein
MAYAVPFVSGGQKLRLVGTVIEIQNGKIETQFQNI